MFVCRFFFFHLYESLKFLLSRGRQAEAVATVHGIAFKNNRKTWLTVDILNAIGGDLAIVADTKMSTGEILKSQLKKFSTDRIAPPFATRRLSVMIKHVSSGRYRTMKISATFSMSDLVLLGYYWHGLSVSKASYRS